jgi:hypothetical protein
LNWVEVYITEDLSEAEIIKGLLESAGIPVVLKDEHSIRTLPGVAGSIRIWAPTELEEQAREEIKLSKSL